MKRERRIGKNNTRTKAIFNDCFEERKVMEYLRNLIHSPLMRRKTEGMLNLSFDCLGEDLLASLFMKKHPELSEMAEEQRQAGRPLFGDWDPFEVADQRMIARFLKDDVTPLLERRIEQLSGRRETDLQKRLHVLQETFRLSDEDREIITLFNLSRQGVLQCYLRNDAIMDMDLASTLTGWANVPLGMSRASLRNNLKKGRLTELRILEAGHCINIADWCDAYLSGLGPIELTSEFFDTKNDVVLDLDSLDVAADDMMVLDTLMRGKGGFNVLFHGEPGTGKTTLAKCLAKEYGQELFTVKIPKENKNNERISGIWATINAAEKRDAVILIDEADSFLFPRKDASHSWEKNFTNEILTQLESYSGIVAFATNDMDGLDHASLRRFRFKIEFRPLTAAGILHFYTTLLRPLVNEVRYKKGAARGIGF